MLDLPAGVSNWSGCEDEHICGLGQVHLVASVEHDMPAAEVITSPVS